MFSLIEFFRACFISSSIDSNWWHHSLYRIEIQCQASGKKAGKAVIEIYVEIHCVGICGVPSLEVWHAEPTGVAPVTIANYLLLVFRLGSSSPPAEAHNAGYAANFTKAGIHSANSYAAAPRGL
jgi:hypothetical protein